MPLLSRISNSTSTPPHTTPTPQGRSGGREAQGLVGDLSPILSCCYSIYNLFMVFYLVLYLAP